MLFFVLFLFFFFHSIECYRQQIVDNDNIWGLQMVYNVRWNHSDNYFAVKREKTTEQAHEGAMHLGENQPTGMEDAEMSFFYMMGGPNMEIKFRTEDGVPYCLIEVFDDKLFTTDLLPFEKYEKRCSFQRKQLYKNDQRPWYSPRLYPFCEIMERTYHRIHWQEANGIYNRPSITPDCIYDFHSVATVHNEYEFFRYCAKGYYYHGMDYFDYPNSNIAKLRKDWLLYLVEGQVQCKISGNVEEDQQLLSRGYTIELIQYNYPQRLFNEMKLCPKLSATLTSYHDKRKDGKFFFAAMVGAAQLDGQFEWSYKEPMEFWDKETYRTEYERMNLDERACYLQYHKQLLRDDGRYGLKIKVTHYCSGRGLRTSTSFDVSIGPEQVPDGIYEDTGLMIDLTAAQLRRTTGQALCAHGYNSDDEETKSDCEMPNWRSPNNDHDKKEGDSCTQNHECPAGFHCFGKLVEHCHHSVRGPSECAFEKEKAVCTKGSTTPGKADCSKDPHCHDDEFCMSSDYYAKKDFECHKLRFKEEGEPCCCKHDSGEDHRECFPGMICTSDDNGPGVCVIR